MAVTTPLHLNGVPYNGEAMRRGLSGLLAQTSAGVPRSGVLGPAPSVTLSGSTVRVSPFNAAVSSGKGAYLLAVDSVTDAGTLAVADATNSRRDRVVLEVLDPDNGSGGTTRSGRLRVIAGTPAALPDLPPLPAMALHIAQIQVPKSPSGAAVTPVVTIDAPFTATAGAPIPVRTVAERDALLKFEGAQALRLDAPGRTVDVVVGGVWSSGGEAKQPIRLVASNYQADPPRDGDALPQEPPSVYRSGRRVHLSGVASNKITISFAGGTEYILGYLDEGYRPAKVEYFVIEVAFVLCRVWVRPDGEIRFMFGSAISNLPAPIGRFTLSGISFDAAA